MVRGGVAIPSVLVNGHLFVGSPADTVAAYRVTPGCLPVLHRRQSFFPTTVTPSLSTRSRTPRMLDPLPSS